MSASASSTGDNFRAAINPDSSATERSWRSVAIVSRWRRLGAEARCPDPPCLRDVEHDSVGTRVLDVDVAVRLAASHAERLLDVLAAPGPGLGEPPGAGVEAFDLEADVVDAAPALPALHAGRRVVLEVEDGQVDVTVGQETTARPRVVDFPDLFH